MATASLELGIDIGDVDLAVQIGATRAIATFLQRMDRAGHAPSRVPKGRMFSLTIDELSEAEALLIAVGRKVLDRAPIPRAPLDALRLLGFRGYQAHRAAHTLRKHDEAALRSLAKIRHDRAGYLDTARQWIRDLENTLRAELGHRPSWVDAGWDTDSLRQEYGGKDQAPNA